MSSDCFDQCAPRCQECCRLLESFLDIAIVFCAFGHRFCTLLNGSWTSDKDSKVL